jgi:P-type Mg2+ transporter
MTNQEAYWAQSGEEALKLLETAPTGLSSNEAQTRLAHFGRNILKAKKKSDWLTLLASQFKSPIILILLFSALLSFFTHDDTDASIIMGIVLVSGLLGFWQEWSATDAVGKLLETLQRKTTVRRNGKEGELPVEDIVPGDIIVLSAGANIPADCLILQSNTLFVNEATLTGETYPVEKTKHPVAPDTALAKRTNLVFMGTNVISGSALALVVHTGRQTEFGKISDRLRLRPAETEFERGVRRFGYFLMEVTLLLVIAIFAFNVYLHRPVLDSFLFSLALAVGLTPQLLPAIISVNLAHGAKRMAEKKVIVRRLAAIENFGSMNVLCSDKTGTLTEGSVRLAESCDIRGNKSEKLNLYSYLNAFYETGFLNPIDEALRNQLSVDISAFKRTGEIPYDFVRKRLTVLAQHNEQFLLITKGALHKVLDLCTTVETADGYALDIAQEKQEIMRRFEEFSSQGQRTLGVAYREVSSSARITEADEAGLTFLGFLVFADPPKAAIAETINTLREAGVSLKIITGDNDSVAQHVAQEVGIARPVVLTGGEMRKLSAEALLQRAGSVDVFAEVEPNQKEQIILALRKMGHVVGYMGDGINDASALHAADVGISVDSAADVAKESADIVLLEKDLEVLTEGIREGRTTFANTLKYVFMATSANFGNMFSMAGASLFLPFLPLLPKQILLTNILTDFPEMAIASDSVDAEYLDHPRRWDVHFIRRFMLLFGILSSVFDYLTFGVLLLLFQATPEQFRTGWFLESVISATLVVLVIRSRRPFFKSQPGKLLALATVLVVLLTAALPYTPAAGVLGFTNVPAALLLAMLVIVALYVLAAEAAKHRFYNGNLHFKND